MTLYDPGVGPKGPQLSKLLKALKWAFKSGRNVLELSNIDFKKVSYQNFDFFIGGSQSTY